MSALAHWLEEEGIATTLIALFRPHAEKVRPPRALWVPFELGRPLGPPNDASFQRKVLLAALRLLESEGPPGTIVDFEADDPDGAGDPKWVCPVQGRNADAGGDSGSDSGVALIAEFEAARPHYERAVARFGRTTVGLSGVPIEAAVAFVAAYLDDETSERPRSGMAPASLMRFCVDDIKAFYLEAAGSGEGSPSGRQMADWFWHDTVAGQVIRDIKQGSEASADKQRQAIALKSLVPGYYA